MDWGKYVYNISMKFAFIKAAKDAPKDALFVSIGAKNKDEIVRENGVKTLYLKSKEKMTLRKLFLLVRKMVAMGKGAKAVRLAFNFLDFNDACISHHR